MDSSERMLLESMQADIRQNQAQTQAQFKEMNDTLLYLCRHSASVNARLKNIEDNMNLNDSNTSRCLSKIAKIEGKLIIGSGIIAILVSCVTSILV